MTVLLQTAPSLLSKGALLRSNATISLLFALGFIFPKSRITNHESLPLESLA